MTAEGRTYYFDIETKETRWTLPPPDAELAPGWKKATAKDGKTYFFYPATGATQWSRPTGGNNQPPLWATATMAQGVELLLDDAPYVPLPRPRETELTQSLTECGTPSFTRGERVEAVYRPGTKMWQRACVIRCDGGELVTLTFDDWGDEIEVPLARVRKCKPAAESGTISGRDEPCRQVEDRADGKSWAHDKFDPRGPHKGVPRTVPVPGRHTAHSQGRGKRRLGAEMGDIDLCMAILQGNLRKRERSAEEEEALHVRGGPLPQSNKGHDLLRKMGWAPGEGLGVEGEGGVTPVSVFVEPQRGRRGLGS